MVAIFHLIGFLVTALNVLVWVAVHRRLRLAFPRRGGLLSVLAGVLMLIALHPFFIIMLGSISGLVWMRTALPEWFQVGGMAMQFAAWTYGAMLLIKGAPAAFMGAVRKLRRMSVKEETGTAPEKELVDHERRRALTKAALVVPAAVVATAIGGAVAARQAPKVVRLRLTVGREFTNLHGLTIAQVSDVHVGSYMERERLAGIAEAMNSLRADLHVVTGDLIDNEIGQMADSQYFLRALQPRVGKFMCMGNHEYITGRSADNKTVVDGLRETGVDILVDESRAINFGSDRLHLLGIDYPEQGSTLERLTTRSTRESIEHALKDVPDDGAPRILLSHHPRTFVDAREFPIDLTLSGHTHGGQIVLGRVGDLNFSPVLPFEHYHNGLYVHEGRKLYVNAGAGGWMPVRINCPTEITLIELVAEA